MLWNGTTIRINGCIWPSAIFPSRQMMDLSIFWLALITLNSIIRTLISVKLYWCAWRKRDRENTISRYPFLVHQRTYLERGKRILLWPWQKLKEILGNREVWHRPRWQTRIHRRRKTSLRQSERFPQVRKWKISCRRPLERKQTRSPWR